MSVFVVVVVGGAFLLAGYSGHYDGHFDEVTLVHVCSGSDRRAYRTGANDRSVGAVIAVTVLPCPGWIGEGLDTVLSGIVGDIYLCAVGSNDPRHLAVVVDGEPPDPAFGICDHLCRIARKQEMIVPVID
ncbi:MAG: hypothetical protein LC634_07405 [Sphingomonadales bacterium]|nr:hypothetical protein [Sphingomonadales bacterium]